MTALITCVTNACPFVRSAGGCSLTWLFGVTHETAGRAPRRAAGRRVRRLWPGAFLRLVRRPEPVLDRVDAAHRDVATATARRPLRDHEQVLRQAPGRVLLEHVVLEHEVPRVGPVVRDLVPV